MKLIRHGSPGNERPGMLLTDGALVDVSDFGEDYDERFFETDGLTRLAAWLDRQSTALPTVHAETRLGPPVCRPSKLVCVGLNYVDHARESGMAIPSEPIIFFKATSAIVGPRDDVMLPRDSTKTDWEVELAVVIGRLARYVSEADAPDFVAGYVLHNDYSERAFQLEREGQWVKGKSCDTFAPIGPFLATKDEIGDPHDLGIWLTVNGEFVQKSHTSNLIFRIPHLVSYISRFMTLLPGDVISTGTPAGVGLGLDPPRYLKVGDVVESGIDGLGSARQVVRPFAE